MTLAGKVALLTGVRRVGGVVAETLARDGADVALVYHRSAREAEATAVSIRAIGRRAVTLQADLADAAAPARVVADTIAALGRVDVLVAMASVYQPVALAEINAEVWDAQLNVELRSAFLAARAVAPLMAAQGGGRIILCSDWVAASGRPRYLGYVHYYVAKAGLKALGEALALELAPHNILVNTVAPGPIVPPTDASPAHRDEVTRATPLGRWGGEAAVAEAVHFLVHSDFVTGETVRVDGGRHLR